MWICSKFKFKIILQAIIIRISQQWVGATSEVIRHHHTIGHIGSLTVPILKLRKIPRPLSPNRDVITTRVNDITISDIDNIRLAIQRNGNLETDLISAPAISSYPGEIKYSILSTGTCQSLDRNL